MSAAAGLLASKEKGLIAAQAVAGSQASKGLSTAQAADSSQAPKGLSTAQIAARLQASADDLGPHGYDAFFGYGLVNAAAALE